MCPAKGRGGPRGLRPRTISTFGTTNVVGRQSYAPAIYTPGEIPITHFQRLSRPQGTWFFRKEPKKKSQVTPPEFVPGTVRLVAQRLNHYTTQRIWSVTTSFSEHTRGTHEQQIRYPINLFTIT